MRVVIEGFIYQVQANGGISRIFNEVIPRMCDMDQHLRLTILTNGVWRQQLPVHPSISYQVGDCDQAFKRSRNSLWHCTYFTPPEDWEGVQVVTVYDMIPEVFKNFFNGPGDDPLRERKKNAILKADAVIAISENTKRDLVDILGVNPDIVSVVHLSRNPLFRRLEQKDAPETAPSRPFFLYVGDRNHYKNFDGLLTAYAAWPRNREAELVVVGGPFSKTETEMILRLGILDQVRPLEKVSDEELCRLYNAAAAFVYPSYGEGFGIPLLEAMACGCPVIASDIPTTREVAGDCPVYFDPAEIDGLIENFDAVLLETRDSSRVRQGLEVVGKYSWEKAASGTLEVYRKALRDKGRFYCSTYPDGHYYSPVPSLEDVARREAEIFAPDPDGIKGVDLNEKRQLELLRAMKDFRDEFPFSDQPGKMRYGLRNDYFGRGDAFVLYGMMRKFRPQRLVEIGSGFSSAAILDISDIFLGGGLGTVFIDPYPQRLRSILRQDELGRVKVREERVQDVERRVFEELCENDVLFVDSSHVCKAGGDVNHILFEILPLLKTGVLIHFHDIFYPFEYPKNWIMGGRFWNECYVLRAFLQYNSSYSIQMFNSFLARRHAQELSRDFPLLLAGDSENQWVEGCSSLWLRKE